MDKTKPSERIKQIESEYLSQLDSTRNVSGSWIELDIWAIIKYLDEQHQERS